jgi:glycosyltransferase involved in cell wall biosynthesis
VSSNAVLDVSVVIAAYQSEPWIEETLASIRAQTLAPREIVVVDDGSRDRTAELAERAGARVLRTANGGPSAARNAGVRAALAPWIAFCDSDDLWEPHKLERHAEAIRLAPEAELTFSDWIAFDERGVLREKTLRTDPDYQRVRRACLGPGIVRCAPDSVAAAFYRSMFILTSTVVARRAALVEAGLFPEALRVAEDYDLFLRLLARREPVVVEEALVRYRRREASISEDVVANVDQHALLRERIAAAPSLYPPGAVAFLRGDRARQSRAAGAYAARLGRFREARRLLRESIRLQPALGPALLYALAAACDNPLGRRVHAALRARWRAGRWRYL